MFRFPNQEPATMPMKRILFASIALCAGIVSAKPCTATPYTPAFIANTYTLIAREPDSGKTYSGTVLIKNLADKAVRVIETVSEQPKKIWGGHFRAASPGEGCVLALESEHDQMSCLVSIDLDNYARLSCVWENKNKRNKNSGLAAMFPVTKI